MASSTKDSLNNNNPRISFPIYIDHEKKKIIPQYIHPIINSDTTFDLYCPIVPNLHTSVVSPPRRVLIDPKTGQEERFREKWSEKENTLFLEYLSANFHQWQFHKGEFYKWLSNNVFNNKYTNMQIENRWKQIYFRYNKIVKERQKGINKEWIYFDKVQEILVKQKNFENDEQGDDDEDENDNQEEKTSDDDENDDENDDDYNDDDDDYKDDEIDSDSNDEYYEMSKQPTEDGELFNTKDRDPWTFEEKILLMDTIKEHIDKFLQNRVKFLKWISKNHLPKFRWKTIRNKLWMLSPNYRNKKARLNKKNITEQDIELWSRIDEFFQFLNNKRFEMKSKNKKKRNDHKKRQKISKHERKRNPKHDLTPLTLKYSHGISYDEQKLLKYGHSLLKYADEKNTDEISEILGTIRWPEKLELLKVIPPKYVKTDIFESENAEQLIFKPNYSDDTFNLMIKYLSTPFKGGLTRNVDTYIDNEVREMVDSIDKAHREYETDDVESESGLEENDQENNENYDDYKGKKRKRVADGVNENYVIYERSRQDEENYESDHNESSRRKKHEDQKRQHKRAAYDINKNDIDDHRVHQSEEYDESEEISDESGNQVYNHIVDKKLFCYKCGTAGHVSKFCSLHSSEYYINMRKQYSSVFVECALRQILDSIGFIFQNNIQNPTGRLMDENKNIFTTQDDDYEENSDLFQAETQGESSTSTNHSGINIVNCTTNSAKPTSEPTIKWDTVLRAAEMAGLDAIVIKNTHARISKYFNKDKQFEDFTSILESSRNKANSTDYLDGPDQLNIWYE